MNRLSREQRCQIVRALVEGNSIAATVRMTGVAKTTVLRLLEDVGKVCAQYQDDHLVNLDTRRIECDEIWSFVGAKQKNVKPSRKDEGIGDIWTWTAIDATSKLVVYWTIGMRDTDTACDFMEGVAKRLRHRVQLKHGRPPAIPLRG